MTMIRSLAVAVLAVAAMFFAACTSHQTDQPRSASGPAVSAPQAEASPLPVATAPSTMDEAKRQAEQGEAYRRFAAAQLELLQKTEPSADLWTAVIKRAPGVCEAYARVLAGQWLMENPGQTGTVSSEAVKRMTRAATIEAAKIMREVVRRPAKDSCVANDQRVALEDPVEVGGWIASALKAAHVNTEDVGFSPEDLRRDILVSVKTLLPAILREAKGSGGDGSRMAAYQLHLWLVAFTPQELGLSAADEEAVRRNTTGG